MEELLKKKMEEIKMTGAMQERILQNCLKATEKERTDLSMMEKKNNKRWFQKPLAVAAAFALCLTLGSVTALAANGKLEGFFKDITDWRGAVTGTTYEQATDEITVNVIAEAGVLKVEAVFVEAEKAPYSEVEQLTIGKYRMIDANGNTVAQGDAGEAVPGQDGQADLTLDVEELPAGQYTLQLQSFIGSKKAEQPLSINGNWECEFSIQ